MSLTSRILSHVIEVRGDFACFSRPELSVERFSLALPNPSACRGILEAIYFKPRFRWQIEKIELLNVPSYIALRRNEVKNKVPETSVKRWMEGKEESEPLWADADKSLVGSDQKGRTQRQTMALRNPHFRLQARIVPRPGFESEQTAFDEQFERRASQGKCAWQPAFGCREFPAFFDYIHDPAKRRAEKPPAAFSQDLGYMVYDTFDLSEDNHTRFKNDWKSVRASVSVFKAVVTDGVLEVPDYTSDLVLKPGFAERSE